MKPHKLMLALFLTVTLLIAGTVAFHITNEPVDGTVYPFEMELSVVGDDISIDCITGCYWENIGFSVRSTYTVYKAGTGIETPFSMPSFMQEEGYVFSVSTKENEVKLKSRRGTNWDSLTIACPSMNCSFRFNEDGIKNVRKN